jgi:hypothetical protein
VIGKRLASMVLTVTFVCSSVDARQRATSTNEKSSPAERYLALLHAFSSGRTVESVYSAANAETGWHRIEVRLRGRKGTVKARTGYWR